MLWPLYSPLLSSIELNKKGVVRRSKLYYLRDLTGKASRIKEKLDFLITNKNSDVKSTKEGVGEVGKEANKKKNDKKAGKSDS